MLIRLSKLEDEMYLKSGENEIQETSAVWCFTDLITSLDSRSIKVNEPSLNPTAAIIWASTGLDETYIDVGFDFIWVISIWKTGVAS